MKKKSLALTAAIAVLIASVMPLTPLRAISNTVYVQAASNDVCTVSVASGYLALRSDKAYNYYNEIGQLYSGDTVQILNRNDPTYWYVYSPKLSLAGYVNRNYLKGAALTAEPVVIDMYTVNVSSGYLALRSEMSYDSSNEIGQLHSGDKVQVLNKDDSSTYWFVYSPKLDLTGYVNKEYLSGLDSSSFGPTYTVRVTKNYLALRSAKGYDYRNEIGKLYTGDTVTLKNDSDPVYWYVYSPKLNLSGYVNRYFLY